MRRTVLFMGFEERNKILVVVKWLTAVGSSDLDLESFFRGTVDNCGSHKNRVAWQRWLFVADDAVNDTSLLLHSNFIVPK